VSDLCLGDGEGDHGLLEQSVKDESAVAGASPVEPEGELLQIGLEVGRVNRAVMGAEDPALE
jgi:hypothetical protein